MLHALATFALLLICHAADGCVPLTEEPFIARPQNMTANVGENVRFNCTLNPIIEREFSESVFLSWTFQALGDRGQVTLINGGPTYRLTKNYLLITNVEERHVGKYFCVAPELSWISLCSENFREEVTLSLSGPPVFFMLRNDPYPAPTLTDLEIEFIISGYPKPTVSFFYLHNNGSDFFQVTEEKNSRVSFYNNGATFLILIKKVRRADNGTYRILATNIHGAKSKQISIQTEGPDSPIVTVSEMIISSYNISVQLYCSVQKDAYTNDTTTIIWIDTRNNIVLDSSPTSDVYISDYGNGTVQLSILSLDSLLVGMYICNASNNRGMAVGSTVVYGPPPHPLVSEVKIKVNGSSVTINWKRPDIFNFINMYRVIIYQANASVPLINEKTPVYPSDHLTGTFTFSDLQPGKYDVTVTSVANNVQGDETPRQQFEIGITTTFPTVIVAATIAGILGLVIVVAITICNIVYCWCSCYARRKQLSSQEQRWGSDEEKTTSGTTTGRTTTTMTTGSYSSSALNTYTTLSLNDSSDLPPSPMSPMSSAVGIDPKWEFPRENINLSDMLAEGQFTVLYKAMAKGLKDNRSCEVAVKSLKDGATEDDLKALIYEMDMLASIEEHPSIVSLVRVCSVGKPIFMVMEYMCHGDLLGFLRSCRGHPGMYTVSPGPRYQPPTLQLCSRDLLNMATKIANGMHFLADRKIVHRALCAKNILVGTGMDVKIYNVGSFDAVDNRDGLVKWMAPETLFDGTNTTYSDVWSFGVTLWELVTIGGDPYGEILPEKLYPKLQGGMRMACPPHCAQEVYDIMLMCWEKNPTDRPYFAVIHENLDDLANSKLTYLDLRSYDSTAYSQFGSNVHLSTAL